ncbi:streptophobe family protein [Streptomyces griseocarneus]|uniref:streptophobe family protein n=1 Tax=Streptomyces griseocarneus TaxID=51201 RepID=UPI00167C5B7B|nr:streptophobe family protein [Streptomyces griseocarneus]MBZ6474253.1 streptophobe family protein [Streptomyces griseocarneus]
MSQPPTSRAPQGAAHELRAWAQALAAVVAGVVAMAVVAALGLWAAGAADLPGGAFAAVVAAAMVTAVGGTVELSGDAGFIARTGGGLAVVPLSVTLAGALALAVLFLLPLRHHAVTSGRALLARVARTAVLWLLALLLIALAARHTFRIQVGEEFLDELGEALGATPTVGFRAAVGPTLGYGLLWLLVLLAVALAASRKAPLPSRLLRFQDSVRPAAFVMVVVLLAYVVLGLLAGVVAAFTRGHAAQTFAVLLLGLPNLAWMAFGIGLGGAWEGRVPGDIGLPVPKPLAAVLRETDGGSGTVDLSSLSEYDGRAWLLALLAGLALLAAGFVLAVRSPGGTSPWRLAVRLAVAVAVTLLVVGLLTRVSAIFGLSLLGLGDLGDFGGEVSLHARLLRLVGFGLLWGLLAGFIGGLAGSWVRRRGEGAPPGG